MADHIPTYMPTTNRPMNDGKSMDDDTGRLDAIAKVTGAAKFGRDVFPDNGLFIGFIRCPWGRANLASLDKAGAEAVDGVIEVNVDGDEGKYHGAPIGYVVAESPLALHRGHAALKAKWMSIASDVGIGDPEIDDPDREVAATLEKADGVLEATYTTPVQTHSSLETHGTSVDYQGDRATIYASTQGTFVARDGIERALRMPESRFKVVCEYVGGGFGSKLNGAGKEGVTAAQVAAKYKRPAYLFCDRREEHLDTGNRPSSRSSVRIGYKKDGTILGGLVQTWGGTGVAGGGGGVVFPSGRYDLGNAQKRHANVRFNGGGPRAFRAPGHPQGAFAEELMIDEVAARTGVDPLELRRRLDTSDERRAMYDTGAELIGWKSRRRTGAQTGVVRRGFGMGCCHWNRFPSSADAEVVINPDGSVEVRTGSQDIGTGQRTVMGVITAEHLGVPLSVVNVRIGDSTLPVGPASGGSVTASNSAPAMMEAADKARASFLKRIAAATEQPADELDLVDGAILHNGEPAMSWSEACGMLGRAVTGRGRRSRDTMRTYGGEGHSNGCQFVDLEVDTETGVIHLHRIVAIQSCGRVVARKTAESQIIGGVVQGLSYALFEDKILDRNTGAMVNPNLEWYRIAGPSDMPHIQPVLWSDGQTGVRPLGEPPTIPTSGAIACAVFNAIGTPVRSLPLTPDRVLAAVEGGGA